MASPFSLLARGEWEPTDGHSRGLSHLSFEGRRAHSTHRGVPAPSVIEHLEIVKQQHLRLAVAIEPLPKLVLDRRATGRSAQLGTAKLKAEVQTPLTDVGRARRPVQDQSDRAVSRLV